MSNVPRITIGLPVYNGERYLATVIESLLAQDFADFEFLISDNASTDSTPRICKAYSAKDRRVRYVRQRENIGIFGNLEFVVKNAASPYFMLVGDDDVYHSDFLSELMPHVLTNPALDLVYSDYGYIDANGVTHPSRLKAFMQHEDGATANFARFIRTRICLPMMMGVFRRESFLRALPFVKFRDNMTGGVDLVFLFRFLTYAKVHSVRKVLFYYRLKDRSSSVPRRWMTSRWRLKWRQLQLNRTILTEHIFKIVAGSQFGALQKLWLRAYALLMFVLDFTLMPLVYRLRRKVAEMKK